MVVNTLSCAFDKISQTRAFHIGTTDVTNSPSSSSDYFTVVNGLVLWIGILFDYNASLFESVSQETAQSARTRGGRLKSLATVAYPCDEVVHLDVLLTALDNLSDALLEQMRSSQCFKGTEQLEFRAAVINWMDSSRALCGTPQDIKPADWMRKLISIVGGIILDYVSESRSLDEGGVQVFTIVRQITGFLSKIQIDRPDLKDAALVDFFLQEEKLQSVFGRGVVRTDSYTRDVLAMRAILRPTLDGTLNWHKFVPCHGGGAVANKGIKSWIDKYIQLSPDARVAYLLSHSGLGSEIDYSPFTKENPRSTRTSRFVSVPKTWKKLRGISAEPAELQFWQQGVSAVIDELFRSNSFWRQRVNLHDQTISQKMALSGSLSGDYATVDLTAASDSVSLRLVNDLFGNTELSRWLLGTRSVFTEAGDSTVRLCKFAPMGSCTCFPVECMVFVLAAELAVCRTRTPSSKRKRVCVYGDDIIVPSYAYDELVSILCNLGFTTNARKSFNVGGFRESCGTEAWKGVDIAPVRYKSNPLRNGPTRITSEILSTQLALANGLFQRGLHDARAYLLQCVYQKVIRMPLGAKASNRYCNIPARSAFFATFDGGHSTLASPHPTNFHLERKYDRGLQTLVYQVVRWKIAQRKVHVEEEFLSMIDACRLIEWLARHQSEDYDNNGPIPYSLPSLSSGLRYITDRTHSMCEVDSDKLLTALIDPSCIDASKETIAIVRKCVLDTLRALVPDYQALSYASFDAYDRLPIGATLIPCKKWVDPAYLLASSIIYEAPKYAK